MRNSIIKTLSASILLLSLHGAGCAGCRTPENGNGNGNSNGSGNGPEPVELLLENIVPSSGTEAGGTEIRLEGSGFLYGVADSPAAASFYTSVYFGEIPATGVEVISDTIISVKSPAHEIGFIDVRIENPNGIAECEYCYEYLHEEEPEEPVFEVEIHRITPVRGPSGGGTRVRIEGRNFMTGFATPGTDVRELTAVLFGDNTSVHFDVIDDRIIEAVSPPGNPGDRDLRVQNPNGEGKCEKCFHYYDPVRVDSINPDYSRVEGGEHISLTGSGFSPDTIVTVGGRSAVSVEIINPDSLEFISPQGSEAGRVDVRVMNTNGTDKLRRGLEYFHVPHLILLDPPIGPASGGTNIRLIGEGLAGAESVSFGGVPVSEIQTQGNDLLVVTPPGEAGNIVDVELSHLRGNTKLSGSFAYIDSSARDVGLLLVSPGYGNINGGNTVILAGTGLDYPDTQVRFGDINVSDFSIIDANRISVTVPPSASGPGPVNVQVRNSRGGDYLADAYTYEIPIVIDNVSPSSGHSSGGTEISVTGSGFDGDLSLRVGALPASETITVDENTVTALTPPGSAGPADIVVFRGEGERLRRAVMENAFNYYEDIVLSQVDPPRGSHAGGTYVLISGAGFEDEVEVFFGSARAEIIERKGNNLMAVRSPPGTLGTVDVSVKIEEETAVLRSAFQYYDPGSIRGGASGGPMAGTINITTLDSYTGAPVAEAHVILGVDRETAFQGTTNMRGQITFSDPSLVKAVQVTASRPGYEAVTVARIDSRNLTVFMTPNEGEPADMPPPAPVAFINPRSGTGSVCGFKLPPGRTLQTNQREEAWVWITTRLVTHLPPFRFMSTPQRVTTDCGHFGMASRPGNIAVYAKYGIVTEEIDPLTDQIITSFEPLLMGIARGIEVPTINPPACTVNRSCPAGYYCHGEEDLDPENPASFRWCLCESDEACGEGRICNAAGACQQPIAVDIVLNMHLDLDVPVRIINPPLPPDGSARVDQTFSYLELGGEGAMFIDETMNEDEDEFVFENFPRLPGDGFVFLNMSTAGGGYPLSLCYRREIGDLASGVAIGPMQPMTRVISPSGGVLNGNRLQWSYEGEPSPDVVMVMISEPGFVPLPVWQIILPGTESSVTVPETVMDILREYPFLEILIITARSPRFDFDYFSYRQLGIGSWNSFTQDADYFTVP